MPYFPYSRQSKKKSHRGAITARMIANLLSISGVDHVITIDLHATQMQGFFKCPVDNLVAEPLLARWIKHNVPNWKDGVVVSKNPGGTKRVTSLADALKVNFGIVTTDRRKAPHHVEESETRYDFQDSTELHGDSDEDVEEDITNGDESPTRRSRTSNGDPHTPPKGSLTRTRTAPMRRHLRDSREMPSSPLARSALPGTSPNDASSLDALVRVRTEPAAPPSFQEDMAEEFTDEACHLHLILNQWLTIDQRARDVTVGRLVHGHIVPDDHPSPALSAMSSSMYGYGRNRRPHSPEHDGDRYDPMMSSFMSTVSSLHQENQSDALGGSMDAGASSEEEEEALQNSELETMITLVGNVRGRPVYIVDDMIDKAGSWIAAAETVVKRGGATKVYCIATHGLFGHRSLQDMQDCECIETIIVTNSFPIPPEKLIGVTKLVQLDVAPLLAESIRRNHHGENLSQLYMHYQD